MKAKLGDEAKWTSDANKEHQSGLQQDRSKRQITFDKQTNGLLNRAKELSLLCNAEIALTVISAETGKAFEFKSSKEMADTCQTYKDKHFGTKADGEKEQMDFKQNGIHFKIGRRNKVDFKRMRMNKLRADADGSENQDCLKQLGPPSLQDGVSLVQSGCSKGADNFLCCGMSCSIPSSTTVIAQPQSETSECNSDICYLYDLMIVLKASEMLLASEDTDYVTMARKTYMSTEGCQPVRLHQMTKTEWMYVFLPMSKIL
ncbi:unnamed protein product [Calypogeia fissa]